MCMPRARYALDVGEAVGQREGELADRVRAGFGDVIAGDRHRVEVLHLVVDEELLRCRPSSSGRTRSRRCRCSGPGLPSGCRPARCRARSASTHSRIFSASSSVGSRPLSALNLASCWSMAVLKKHGQDDRRRAVDGHRHRGGRAAPGRSRRTAPSCRRAWRSTRRSCRSCRRCPDADRGSQPYSVTESKAVDRRCAGMPSDTFLKRRLVRKASPSPANMRVGSSPSRLKAKTPAV